MAAPNSTIVPENEQQRLAVVRRYDILDTPPDGAFDRVTALAARLFDVPVSIVSIVDEDRIWFKSHHGVDVVQVDRDPGLCASAILDGDPRILPDASVEPSALANPLVTGDFGLRFYAAAPLVTADGYRLGTLCVIDREPRETTDEDVETLRDLAAIVVDELELRLAARAVIERESALRKQADEVVKAREAEERKATEINGAIVDSLVRASQALDAGDEAGARRGVDETLRHAGRMITELPESLPKPHPRFARH